MPAKTQKIVVRMLPGQRLTPNTKDQCTYRVEKLVNRTEPRVGSTLSEREVDKLISGSKASVDVLAPGK